MTKKERVLKTIRKQPIDYLPSNIYFASYETKQALRKAFNRSSLEDLDGFLENHLYITGLNHDIFRFRGDHDYLKKAEKTVFAKVDWEKGHLEDRWGVVYDIYSDGICVVKHPLRGKSDADVLKYTAPDPDEKDNYALAAEELRRYGKDFLVLLSGYGGIFERGWFLMGYEELLTGMALGLKSVSALLEKIAEYKLAVAKKTVELGFEAGHSGDDFGSQLGLMISKDMWKKYYKPLYKKIWRVYKDAGLPVLFHSCGNVTDIIGDMIDIGLDVLEPVQQVMDFKYLKKEFGKNLTFWGGVGTQTVLPFGTPEEVRRETSEVIETLGKGGGLIIAPDQEIMSDVPNENVIAFVETVREKRAQVLG
jgi:uroporphyrinogen decarboxylase